MILSTVAFYPAMRTGLITDKQTSTPVLIEEKVTTCKLGSVSDDVISRSSLKYISSSSVVIKAMFLSSLLALNYTLIKILSSSKAILTSLPTKWKSSFLRCR